MPSIKEYNRKIGSLKNTVKITKTMKMVSAAKLRRAQDAQRQAADFAREVNATVIIRGLRVFSDFEFEFRIALANQRLHPTIEHVNLMTHEQHTFLSSTIVREIASLGGDVTSMVPPNVALALNGRFTAENDEA